MNALKVWEQFVSEEAIPYKLEQIKQLNKYFRKHKEEIAAEFIQVFDTLCKDVCLRQQEGTINLCSSIYISFLRVELIEGRFVYMLEAFDSDFVGKVSVTKYKYYADWIGRFLIEHFAKL